MDYQRKIVSTIKSQCNFLNDYVIHSIKNGYGGSNNIVLILKKGKKIEVVVKIMPRNNFKNLKIVPNNDQLEIKFYEFFTHKFVITNRTPHIVNFYKHHKCEKIADLLKKINKKKCLTMDEKLNMKNIYYDDNNICDLLNRFESDLIKSKYDVMYMEYCESSMPSFIGDSIYSIKQSKENKLESIFNDFFYNLHRLLLQIIFTMAIIKEDYPGFFHADLFMRNILICSIHDKKDTDYVAYHYNQRIFYLPANGLYAKISDFGRSILENELEPSTYSIDKSSNKYYNYNPFNKKNDIFTLLYDIYDGENFGAESIISLSNKFKMPKKRLDRIRNFMNIFIKTSVIDKIKENHASFLDSIWYIDNIKTLENTILTPHEYLTNGSFEIFQILPDECSIIKHYNKP